ncbi:hypothetical protein BJ912DRAFT_805466, partial [Pholiota molesta]
KEKGWKPSQRSQKSNRPRAGKWLREAGDTFLADTKRLRAKLVQSGDTFLTKSYSLELNGSRVSTGWQGSRPPDKAREQIQRAYSNGSIRQTIATFFPVPADLKHPAFVMDANSRIFLFRTAQFSWLKEEEESFYQAVRKLLDGALSSEDIRRKSAKGVRGPHFPCIIGHHREYAVEPYLTKWHRDNQKASEEFISNPLIQKITKRVSSVVRLIFPGVAERFLRSAQWHKEKYGIMPLFDLFWNFCVNGLFPGQKRVHCQPHTDSKNVVGVCVLVIYQIPGKKFNHTKRSWLVLWEAGVVVELPPWTMVAYPSSLLYHFNIDITDFKFVTTEGQERPLPENSTPIEEGDDEGRGSLVYFNQASMYRCSEEDADIDAEGAVGETDSREVGKAKYSSSIQEAFLAVGT